MTAARIPFATTLIFALVLGLAAGVRAQGAGDSVTAWERWPDIEPAVELRDLDGPDDIVEKAEIIEDRVDELVREGSRLSAEIDLYGEKLDALRTQHEVLQELAEIRMGGDTQMRQQVQDLAQRIRRQQSERARRAASLAALDAERLRLAGRAVEYRERARLLRIEEGGNR